MGIGEHQKPVTDEYRDHYDDVFKCKHKFEWKSIRYDLNNRIGSRLKCHPVLICNKCGKEKF